MKVKDIEGTHLLSASKYSLGRGAKVEAMRVVESTDERLVIRVKTDRATEVVRVAITRGSDTTASVRLRCKDESSVTVTLAVTPGAWSVTADAKRDEKHTITFTREQD